MGIRELLTEYAGLPVFDFEPDTDLDDLPAPDAVAWRVRVREDDRASWAEVFHRFLMTVDTTEASTLITGFSDFGFVRADPDPISRLLDSLDAFPSLRSLFLSEVTQEEKEISWIALGDITPLLDRLPELERLDVRGRPVLSGPVVSSGLKTLRFESGGLPAEVVRAVGASTLPALRHLDFWLGVDEWGGNTSVADLAPILSGERLPSLRHLGLQNSEIQDEIAAAVAGAPVVARLESLGLGMGSLSDVGAEALLSGQPLTHLGALDLHHHLLSEVMMRRVRDALPGVEVDLDDRQEFDEDAWPVAVAE